ncbi:MAG: nitroreductase [Magnetospirillum sp.]
MEPLPSAHEVLVARRSCRAFDPTRPVDKATVQRIVELAARAPSGSNIQPWQVEVVSGAARDRLVAAMLAAFDRGEAHNEWPYYPPQWSEPYLGRRRALGKALYALAGVAKGDEAAARAQMARNFALFDAPVGVVVTIDSHLAQGSWLDLGGFMMGLMVAAGGFGLESCPMQAPAQFAPVIRQHLGVPAERQIACVVALGHAEPGAAVNRLHSDREPLAAFARFHQD